MSETAQDRWIERVLGFKLPGAGSAAPGFDEAGFRRNLQPALSAWRDASEQVDAQINELRRVLLATSDDALHKIAEFGLNGITGPRKVGLQKALREIDGASGPALPSAAAKAVQAAEAFRGFVQSDPRVQACDTYPKIKTPIGPTLGRALGALAQALAI